jgi:hypothetical protein
MSERLAADLLLIESAVRRIEALCAALAGDLADADEGDRAAVGQMIELTRALDERVAALRRRYPLPRAVPLPATFA